MFWNKTDKMEMWTIHIHGPAKLFEACLMSSQVNACSISQCFVLGVFSFVNGPSGWVTCHCWRIHYPVCWTNTFVNALLFCSTHKLVCLKPINHKLPDSSEAQMLIVFLAERFKVVLFSASGLIDIFLYNIGLYSVQYMLLLFLRSTVVVILMLSTECDVFIIVSFIIWVV